MGDGQRAPSTGRRGGRLNDACTVEPWAPCPTCGTVVGQGERARGRGRVLGVHRGLAGAAWGRGRSGAGGPGRPRAPGAVPAGDGAGFGPGGGAPPAPPTPR